MGTAQSERIPVVEIFGPTIQGEGAMAGVQTFFIRLGNCDYANVCERCDSMHAVDPRLVKKTASYMSASALAAHVMNFAKTSKSAAEWITISGGNPAMWDLGETVEILQQHNFLVAVETQGSKFMPWLANVDQLTVSPKGPGMLTEQYTSAWSLDNLKYFLEEYEAVRRGGDAVDFGRIHKACLKIPVFCQADLDFVEHAMEVAGAFYPAYISVGNPAVHQHALGNLRETLLKRYENIVEQVLGRPALSDVIVLPQLHVLLWGNKQGV